MQTIIKKIEKILNTPVYAVGGCVRDYVMGIKPKDVDLASALIPSEVIKRATKAGIKAIDVGGKKYGTVVLVVDDVPYEITTFRSDFNPDGRHCDVVFVSSLEEDLARRDFTLNSMAMNSNGYIIDLWCGRRDIEMRKIRAVGIPENRFNEDYLRIIRACRFAARFGFGFEPVLLDVMRRMANDVMKNVSVERIKSEIDKAFEDEKPSVFFELLSYIGLLEHILPEVEALKKIEQPKDNHPEGNAFVHTMMVIDRTPVQHRWAALLHDVGKVSTYKFNDEKGHYTYYGHDDEGVPIIEAIADRMKFSNDLREECKAVCKFHMRPMFLAREEKVSRTAIRRFIRDVGIHMEALKAVVLADVSMRPGAERLDIFDVEIKEETPNVKPIVMGRHLIELGIEPGVEMGKILKQLEEMQLDGKFSTLEEGLKFVKDNLK